MSQWVLLHTGSQFSKSLQACLGSKVRASIHVDDLINDVVVHSCVQSQYRHEVLVYRGQVIEMRNCVVFQEIFYALGPSLEAYDYLDMQYVKNSWQAYLLSLFSYAHQVVNPIKPQNLSASTYQFPRLYHLAEMFGLCVPQYEVGFKAKEGYMGLDQLWFHPRVKCLLNPVVNLQLLDGEWRVIPFVFYDNHYAAFWGDVPSLVRDRLTQLIGRLNIVFGEAYFKVGTHWVFYGIQPQVDATIHSERVFAEMVACLHDLGEGVLDG